MVGIASYTDSGLLDLSERPTIGSSGIGRGSAFTTTLPWRVEERDDAEGGGAVDIGEDAGGEVEVKVGVNTAAGVNTPVGMEFSSLSLVDSSLAGEG